MFLARVEWLPVTSRSHGRHITDITAVMSADKCKISIMIVDFELIVIIKINRLYKLISPGNDVLIYQQS